MNLNELFKNKEEREQAINNLKSLVDNPNWKFMVEKILQQDIEDISTEILDKLTLENENDLARAKDLKRKRAYFIIMSQLPEKLIDALKENKDDPFNFDPYPRDINEIE